MTTIVSYASIIADDIEALCGFYATVLDLPEVDGSTDIYRGLDTGTGTVLAFSASAVYGLLGIEDYAHSNGTRQYLTFETGSDDALDERTAVALANGATMLHEPYVTAYNAYQVVLADPENNVFRLNHANTERSASSAS